MTSLTWFVPKFPFPADDGAKQAHLQLLREVSALGVDIHLCTFVEPSDRPDVRLAHDEAGIRGGVTLIARASRNAREHLLNLARHPLAPLTIAQFGTPHVAREVRALLARRRTSTIVYDGLHCAGWQLDSRRPLSGVPASVYRAHNVENEIWTRAANDTTNQAKRLFLRAQARLVEQFERRVVEQSRVVFPVSDRDATTLRHLAPSASIITLPIGIRSPAHGHDFPPPPAERNLLFVGRLDWPPNRDGLRWLLDEVWPEAHARAPDLHLDIVGSGDGSWLEPYRSVPGLRLHGRVDSVLAFYANAAASVVPVFYGGGTRVKAIESSMLGRPCISTELGVEGIGLVEGLHYLRSESRDDWVQILAGLDPKRAVTVGTAAATRVASAFDPVRIAHQFVGALEASNLL